MLAFRVSPVFIYRGRTHRHVAVFTPVFSGGQRRSLKHFGSLRQSADKPLLIDYFEYRLGWELSASGWREELRSLGIDKKNLDKGLARLLWAYYKKHM